jgi:phosphoglycerate dehydrogenase-like enzyme
VVLGTAGRDVSQTDVAQRLVESTPGVGSAGDLARMKPSALLVNTSRAPLIEQGRW